MDNGKSDSANLDSVVELLVQSSKSPTEALMIMVPEAFRSQPALNSRPEVRESALCVFCVLLREGRVMCVCRV